MGRTMVVAGLAGLLALAALASCHAPRMQPCFEDGSGVCVVVRVR